MKPKLDTFIHVILPLVVYKANDADEENSKPNENKLFASARKESVGT